MRSHIEETNRALEEHLEQTKTRDAIVAVLCGVAFGAMAYLLLGTGGTTPSGGISPTVTTREGWPVLGTLAGLVGGVVVARVLFTQLRQRRRRRFWGP
jgi:fructose-specific phosphotransferase system IIC component